MATGFAASVRSNSNKALARVNNKCYDIARELFSAVIAFTPSPSNPGPFAKGFLVDQWYPNEGQDFSEELSSTTSPNGEGSISRVQALRGMQFFGDDGAITLANNLSYAYRAEVLGWPSSDGWSGKIGPYRMVARALQLIKAKYT